MQIYKLTSPNTELVYVGKTIQTLAKRISEHRSNHKRYVSGKTSYVCSSIKVIEFGGAVIELIEETDDESREAHWIRELAACNHQKLEVDWSDHATKAEYDRKYNQKHYQANKDAILERQKKKIPCDHCGSFIRRNGLATHKKTKICLEFIQEPVLCNRIYLPFLEQPTV